MSNRLSTQDISRLLQNPSSDSRADIAAKVAEQYRDSVLNDSERQLALDIFRVMINDAAVRVREALSHNLKATLELPHDLALALARDVESVALPMIESSAVLTEDDLIEIVESSNPSKQIAVARRSDVPVRVADALIDSRNDEAVATLVGNQGAQLTEKALLKVIDGYGDAKQVHEGIVRRAQLPITVAERLVAVVSESLRDYLVAHHELSPNIAADLVLESRERATVSLLSSGTDEMDVLKLVRQLKENGRLTPSLILRALCTGDLALFEAAVAVLANAPIVNCRTLIHDKGRLGLWSIYMRTGLPERLYPAFRVAVDVARETGYDGGERDNERRVCRMIERILTQYEDLGQDNLDYLLKKLNQIAA
jgi:uncharacterized protein (DUF2336 family)